MGLVAVISLASVVVVAPATAALPDKDPRGTAKTRDGGIDTGAENPGSGAPAGNSPGDQYVNEDYEAPNCWYVPSNATEYGQWIGAQRSQLVHEGVSDPATTEDLNNQANDLADNADDTTSTYYKLECTDWLGEGADQPQFIRVPNGEAPPQNLISPFQVAQIAMKRWEPPTLQMTLAPNPPTPSTVNLATQVAIEDPGVQEPAATTVAGVSVQLTITPTVKLYSDGPAVITPGDGRCPTSGGSFRCTVTFGHASTGKPAGYALTAAVTWTATWTVNGQQGDQQLAPLEATNQVNVPVREIQTKVTESN